MQPVPGSRSGERHLHPVVLIALVEKARLRDECERWIGPRRIPFGVVLPLLVLCGLGCGDATGNADGDAGLRDATIVEAGPQPDALVDALAVADGGRVDDAAVVTCRPGDCDPTRTEDNCGGSGACRVGPDGPACSTDVGSIEDGGFCLESSDCAAGLTCFRVNATEGICSRPCCPGSAVCALGQECVGAGVLDDGSDSGWWRCSPPRSCDLLDAESCAPGEGCYIVSESGETDCRRSGEGDVGEACDSQNDCAPGLFCGGLTGTTCVRICRIRANSPDCSAAEGECVAYPHTPAGSGLCTPDTAEPW